MFQPYPPNSMKPTLLLNIVTYSQHSIPVVARTVVCGGDDDTGIESDTGILPPPTSMKLSDYQSLYVVFELVQNLLGIKKSTIICIITKF